MRDGWLLKAGTQVALVFAVFLASLGVAQRKPSLREMGLAAFVLAVVLGAWWGPERLGWWAVVVAPMAALVGEGVRVVADLRRRDRRQRVEPSCLRATVGAIAVVTGFAAALSVLAWRVPRVLWPASGELPEAAGSAGPADSIPSSMIPISMSLLVVGFSVVAVGTRRLSRRRQATARPMRALVLGVLAVALAAVALAAAADAEVPASGTAALGTPILPDTASTADGPGSGTPQPPGRLLPVPDFGDGGTVVVFVLALLGLLLLLLFSRRMRLLPPEDLVPDPVARVPLQDQIGTPLGVQTLDREVTMAAIDEAIVELRQDADPRVAVRVAYAIVTRGLGDPRLVRRPAESEGEFLARALGQLGAGAAPLRELTSLFWRARFSEETIDEAMRDRALRAMAEIREQVGAPDRGAVAPAEGGVAPAR